MYDPPSIITHYMCLLRTCMTAPKIMTSVHLHLNYATEITDLAIVTSDQLLLKKY